MRKILFLNNSKQKTGGGLNQKSPVEQPLSRKKNMKKVSRLQGNQKFRNSTEMTLCFNNSIEGINLEIDKYNQSKEAVDAFLHNTKPRGSKEHDTYLEHRQIVSSFDPFACITIDGREPQNRGMRQFLVFGKTNLMSNAIWNLRDLSQAYRFLLHSIDFNTDLRLKDRRVFKCSQIKILFVNTIDDSGRPLSWEWVNWDGLNHEWIWRHNESLTFEGTKATFKKAVSEIKTAGTYLIGGLPVFVRAEDLDFVVKKGMNYNLRKVLSAINYNYVGVNNWQE